MTKRRLTFPGYLDSLNEEIPPPETIEPTDPTAEESWRKHVFVGTKALGVFETETFVLETASPLGVPIWTAINTGLPIGVDDLLDLTADPFNPEARQYTLFEDGVYRRESGGNWVQVLTHAAARAFIGAVGGSFPYDGISCNINHDGYIACLYNGTGIPGPNPWATAYLVSTDYGTTWAFKGYVAAPTPLGSSFMSLQVGAYQGSSIHGAGQVIYAHGWVGANSRIGVSLDGGATWNVYVYGFGVGNWESDCLVDPNDQSRVFIGASVAGIPPRVIVSVDHGVTWTEYDLNATQNLGSRSPWHHISVAMNEDQTVRIGSAGGAVDGVNRTDDDGATWQEPSAQWSDNDLGISLVQDSPFFLYIMKQTNSGGAATDWHTIWASEDEGVTMVPKSGANCSIAGSGGGDSIPFNCEGIRGIVEVWTDQDSVPGKPWTEPPIGRLPGPVPEHSHPTLDHDHTSAADDGGILTNDEHDGFLELAEIAIPAAPAANFGRFYAKDNAGTEDPYWRRSDGSEANLTAGGGGNVDAWRADRTVDPLGGGTDLTLQAAVTALGVGGGGIFVMPGGYNENVTIPANTVGLMIRGAGRDLTRIQGAAGSSTLTTLGNMTDLSVRDLTLYNAGNAATDDCADLGAATPTRTRWVNVKFEDGYRGIYINGGVEHWVERCWTEDNANTGMRLGVSDSWIGHNFVDNPASLGMEISANTIVTGNLVFSSGDDGIIVNGAQNRIIANEVRDAGDFGIRLNSSSASGAVVANNIIDNAVDDCIYIASGCVRCVIEGNNCYDGQADGIWTNGGNNLINDNVIWSCAGNGIFVGGGADYLSITGNMIKDNGADGIQVDNTGATHSSCSGNMIHNNGAWGIDLGSAVNNQYWVIMGNMLNGNTAGALTNHTHATNIYQTAAADPYNRL